MPTAVVTGASSGIGWASAEALRTAGFDVYAGVRTDDDADRVTDAGLEPLRLDVTDPDAVERARREVLGATGDRLDVLVNNAGIAGGGPVEAMTDDELRSVFEVNVFGVHRVTRAFLPAVIASGGRVVQVSSFSGRVAAPFVSAYAASKHALEGYSDSLRREVAPFGVAVSIIEPMGVATPIWEKSVPEEEELARLPDRYAPIAAGLRRNALALARDGLPPQVVAQAVVDAATSPRPRARYAMPRQAAVSTRLLPLLPARLADRIIGSRFD